MNDTVTLDMRRVLSVMKKNMRKLIFTTVLGLVLATVATFMMTPKYSATLDMLVNQKVQDTNAQYTAQQADLQAINTYKDVLTKDIILAPVLKAVKQRDNYTGTEESLGKAISITNQTNSQIISVTATDTNAYTAADIANEMGRVFTAKIKKMMKIKNVTIVSKATVDTTPVFPNKKLNLLVGLVAGLLVGLACAFLKELFDTTVTSVDFLTDELKLTDLGQVYHMHITDKNRGVVSVNAGNQEAHSERRV